MVEHYYIIFYTFQNKFNCTFPRRFPENLQQKILENHTKIRNVQTYITARYSLISNNSTGEIINATKQTRLLSFY